MSCNITCFAKIITLGIATFLYISIGVLCEFIMVSDVYILLSPQEEEAQSFSWWDWCTHSVENSSKRFKPFPAIMLMLNWGNHKQGIMMLITRLSSTL